MNILITGCAGFVGYSLSEFFLKNNKNIKIFGVDNYEDYYSVKYKKLRISKLLNYKKFRFYKLDLSDNKKVKVFFKKKKFDIIFHFAAQAGVRHSIINPEDYLKNNIIGFFNILNFYKNKKKPKKIFYASSSSVYGNSKSFPVKENSCLFPLNYYGVTKKNNEETAEIFSNMYNFNIIGLRFFTIFGEWGRPDMLILKFLISVYKKKKILVYNFGKHDRDFTYIKDVVKIVSLLISKDFKKKHLILNICSGIRIKLSDVINYLRKITKYKNIKEVKYNSSEVLHTHGDNKLVKKLTNFKEFTNIFEAIDSTYLWFKQINKNIF